MDYLVFRSAKSGNRVICPAESSMIIDRANGSAVIYAIGGNGQDRMVWEIPSISGLKVVPSIREALSFHLPASDSKPATPPTATKPDAAADSSADQPSDKAVDSPEDT